LLSRSGASASMENDASSYDYSGPGSATLSYTLISHSADATKVMSTALKILYCKIVSFWKLNLK
jgi:hypothetical protein